MVRFLGRFLAEPGTAVDPAKGSGEDEAPCLVLLSWPSPCSPDAFTLISGASTSAAINAMVGSGEAKGFGRSVEDTAGALIIWFSGDSWPGFKPLIVVDSILTVLLSSRASVRSVEGSEFETVFCEVVVCLFA